MSFADCRLQARARSWLSAPGEWKPLATSKSPSTSFRATRTTCWSDWRMWRQRSSRRGVNERRNLGIAIGEDEYERASCGDRQGRRKIEGRIGRRYAAKPGVQKYPGPVGGSALVDLGGAGRAR